MFKYIKDNVFLKQMGRDVIGHLKSLKRIINNDHKLKVDFKLLGDDPLIMTIQNDNEPLVIPFSLDILNIYDENINESNLKTYIMNSFNKIEGSAFGSSIDSKYYLDTKYIWYTTGNNTKFKIVIYININKDNEIYRLTKVDEESNTYSFEPILGSKEIYKKELRIKQLGLIDKLKNEYLKRMNRYLRNEELDDHPNLDIYFESINEVYKKYLKNK